MPQEDYSANYLLYNSQVTKNLVVALKIEGLDTVLSSSDIFKRIRYGDAGLDYGDPGVVYGGLTPYGDFKSLLDLTGGSLTIQQKIEPEQGRASVTTISLSFIDLNQYMTQLISPGIILDDILGKSVTLYLGYQEISYPEDFLVIFRGKVSNYDSMAGRVTLQLSDPNMQRRSQIFYCATTKLTSDITDSATSIVVDSNNDFFQRILGPDGQYDPAIKTYIQIEDEYIEYPATGFVSPSAFNGCLRGQRATSAVAHQADSDVTSWIQIEDNCIDIALKTMLSGWNGPYLEDIAIRNFVATSDPTVADNVYGITLPAGVDAIRDYGLSEGDYLYITGAAASGNDGTAIVRQLVNLDGQPNGFIITDKIFSLEVNTPAVMSLRSQYDVYPILAGQKLPPTEVDVAQHLYIQSTFLSSDENRLRFFIGQEENSLKTFLEKEVYLPTACYSLTRFGRLSVQLTHAPLADQRLQFLTGANVLNPQNIRPQRGINNRKFFNEIDWDYDFDDSGDATSKVRTIDTDSLNIAGVTVVLPIESKGLRTDLGSEAVIGQRTHYLLSRYKSGAVLLNMDVNWEIGSLIEAGDVVAVQDGGVLQISNLVTGTRNLGTQLFEVQDRKMDIKGGMVSLQLVSGLGAQATDRYGVISPSSILQAGSSASAFVLGDSYGALFPGQEYRKWDQYFGLRMLLHTEDYSTAATCTITGQSATDLNTLTVTGLGIAPSAGMILDIDRYSLSTDPTDQQILKVIHCYFDPEVIAVSGVNLTQVQVPASATQLFFVGSQVSLHNTDYSLVSDERTVTVVDSGTNIITVDSNFNFAPSGGLAIDLVGFYSDQSGAYRLI